MNFGKGKRIEYKGEYIYSNPLGFKKVPKDIRKGMWHEYLLHSSI